MKILRRIPIGPLFVVAAVILNVFHLFIHGTPLDGGSMDAFFTQANMFLSANANVGDVFFWRRNS